MIGDDLLRQRSKIKDQISKMKDQIAWFKDQRSIIMGQRSEIKDRGSRDRTAQIPYARRTTKYEALTRPHQLGPTRESRISRYWISTVISVTCQPQMMGKFANRNGAKPSESRRSNILLRTKHSPNIWSCPAHRPNI